MTTATHKRALVGRSARISVGAGVADEAAYWLMIGAIYLLNGSLWFFSFKEKLFQNGTRPPAGVVDRFAGTIVERSIGMHAAWIITGVLEVLVFAALALSLLSGEFLPTRRKPLLIGGFGLAMLTLGVLMFGTSLTSDYTTSAELFGYFAGTAVLTVLVLLMPPYRGRRWLSAPTGADPG